MELVYICEVNESADFLREIRKQTQSYSFMFTATFNNNFSGKSAQLLYPSDSLFASAASALSKSTLAVFVFTVKKLNNTRSFAAYRHEILQYKSIEMYQSKHNIF
jgi:hypothetical protein